MGIIVSSFKGCGREFIKNTHGDKVKIFDAVAEIPVVDEDGKSGADLLEGYVNKVMGVVEENDIVFIDSSKAVREAFNERGIDYDVFYPSKERRGEFIENQVRKRTKPTEIRDFDKNFEKWVEEIDFDEHENCYKHKLTNQGEFIGNAPVIMQYIDSIKNNNAKAADNE
jgi:hypothetical protein